MKTEYKPFDLGVRAFLLRINSPIHDQLMRRHVSSNNLTGNDLTEAKLDWIKGYESGTKSLFLYQQAKSGVYSEYSQTDLEKALSDILPFDYQLKNDLVTQVQQAANLLLLGILDDSKLDIRSEEVIKSAVIDLYFNFDFVFDTKQLEFNKGEIAL